MSADHFDFRPDDCLLVIDVQRDFCANGALAVPDGDAVVPLINTLMQSAPAVVFTQDWHPADHRSFASQHAGKTAFESITLPYGEQTLWPDHCVQGSDGARFHPQLDTAPAELIVRKGFRRAIDSYSAFYENDRHTSTGLAGYLGERGIGRVVCVGLALDYCVRYSAEDARRCQFDAVVLTNACRAIDLAGSLDAARAALADAGVTLID